MLVARCVKVRRRLEVALGAIAVFALATALAACGAGDDDSAAAPGASGSTCSLAITLSGGGVVFDATGADTKACASAGESGPGMDLTFIPANRSAVSSIEISGPSVEAGVLASELAAFVTVQHTDGRTSRPGACRLNLLENTLTKSEMRGDRYRLRGTGTCSAPDPSTGVSVNGTFAFTSSSLWTKP